MRAAFLGGAAALIAASPAAAARGSSATTQGVVAAEVVEPIVVTMLSNLDFGMLTSSRTAGGAVTVDAASGAHYIGGTSPACLGGGGCPGIHASRFAVRGEAGRSYVVSAPAALVATGTLAGSAGAAPNLAIEALTVRTESRPGNGPTGMLDVNGLDHFSIGGTLVVPAGTGAAHYQATLAVVVTYS